MPTSSITPFANDIAARQYYHKDSNGRPIEDYEGMLHRVARHVARAEAIDAYKKDNGRYPEWYLSFEGRRKNLLNLESLDEWIDNQGYRELVDRWEEVFFEMLIHKRFCPGGRILAGSESNYGQLQNCLQGDTLVHTLNGHVPIKSLRGAVTVRSLSGEWRRAEFDSYGLQELWEVEFINGQRVKATAEHLWPVPHHGDIKRVPTKELVNQNVLVEPTTVRPARNEEYWEGVRHGMVFGDGSKNTEGYTYSLRAFVDSEREAVEEIFVNHTLNRREDYTEITYRPQADVKLKELPSEDASDSYWYGFFCGFFAADGGIDERGSAGLYQSNAQCLNTLATKLPFMGIIPGQVRVFREESNFGKHYEPNYRLTLLKQSLVPQDFIRQDQRETFVQSLKDKKPRRPTLKVISVTPLGYKEEVFCCQEPETHTFVIEGGILTSNCFVLGPNGRYVTGAKDDPDSIDGIYELSYKLAKVTKAGGGCGITLNDLRESGSKVWGSGGRSSGPVSFLRNTYNTTLRVIQLEGVRRGAGMATMAIDHPDALDFITAKDLDRTAVEGGIECFNISLLVTHAFMENVRNDGGHVFISRVTGEPIHPSPVQGKYHLPGTPATSVSGNPKDPATSKEIPMKYFEGVPAVPARWLWNEIVEHAWQTGDPGILFIDQINAYWPMLDTLGPLRATNPCGEEPLHAGESCCLGSLVLDQFVKEDKTFDFTLFKETIETAVRFLDNVLTINVHPIEDTQEWCDRLRRIGLGVMGDAVAMLKLGAGYANPNAQMIRKDLADFLATTSTQASENLGKEKGYFPLADKLPDEIPSRRNVHTLSIAPTGTISMICDTSSGIEPIFALAMQRRVGREYKFRLDPTFENYLRTKRPDINLDDETQFVRMDVAIGHDAHGKAITEKVSVPAIVKAIMDNHGSIQGNKQFTENEQELFTTAHDVSPVDHVRVQGVWQRNMDGPKMAAASISKTVNLANSATKEDIAQVFELGYEQGLKGITIYRDGSKAAQVLRTSTDDTKKTETKSENKLQPQEVISPAPEPLIMSRPRRTEGHMVKAEFRDANGRERKVYVYVGWDDIKYPLEVFITDEDGGYDVHPYAAALGKMISMALKYGAPPDKIARKLKRISGGSVSYSGGIFPSVPAMVGALLQERVDELAEELLGEGEGEDVSFRQCDGECNMVEQGGCQVCLNCGFSRCG